MINFNVAKGLSIAGIGITISGIAWKIIAIKASAVALAAILPYGLIILGLSLATIGFWGTFKNRIITKEAEQSERTLKTEQIAQILAQEERERTTELTAKLQERQRDLINQRRQRLPTQSTPAQSNATREQTPLFLTN